MAAFPKEGSGSEVTALESIAALCPSDYGQAVYLARGLAGHYTGKRYGASNNCERDRSESRSVESTHSDNKLVLSPNPVDNLLNITCDQVVQSISVLDISGRVQMATSGDRLQAIDVSSLNPGLYLVHASTIDNQTYVQKFIKQ